MNTFVLTLLCVFVGCVSATYWPFVGQGIQPKIASNKRSPEKCCGEPYFTYEGSNVIVSAPDGVLGTELIHTRGAYDSIAKKIGRDTVTKFPNGTEDIVKYIADYETGESYISFTHEGKKVCLKVPLTSGFPYECISEEATYIGSVTLGDRALEVHNWYKVDKIDPTEEYHTVLSIKEAGCIATGYLARLFDPETGRQIDADAFTVSDYSLGICDRDYWFKPPPECEPERVQTVQKVPKQFRRFRGLHGKRLFK